MTSETENDRKINRAKIWFYENIRKKSKLTD